MITDDEWRAAGAYGQRLLDAMQGDASPRVIQLAIARLLCTCAEANEEFAGEPVDPLDLVREMRAEMDRRMALKLSGGRET